MTTPRTLQPEDRVAHYRVVGPLGAGGMGEVYLAQDQTLERNVALKVLPQELVRSEERVRRFVQEAKSASSLNHPNIITIYEIGQDTVRSAAGEPSTGSVQYISMELVSGKTLGAKIHDEKTDLKTLLGYLAQAAEGIAKAHAAGIVHRDLKPGNVMVSDDGFAKVLDFGLAKLTERRGGEASATAMTEVADRTTEGAVMGTVHYMSPEQVQGKSVDQRSDVFSFGCILYEAATRRRPFVADSNVETMHKILNEKPQPIEEINASVPAELRRLIRRCLNKSPDQRLQSMKDVAIELREIVDEYDSLSASATSATTGSGGTAAVQPGRRLPLIPVIAAGAVVVAAGLFFALRGGREAPVGGTSPFETMRLSTETSNGSVNNCILSPDGRYLAYLVQEAGRWGMYVRQVATGTDVEVIPMSDRRIEFPVFSPDGNYLFYLGRKPDAPMYRTLFRMASLGGSSEEKAFDVDSRVSFSPDGKQFAFVRGYPREGRTSILVMPTDGGAEREVAALKAPEAVATDAVWSPDGKRIAVVSILPPPAASSTIATFDAATGARADVVVRKQAFYNGLAWMGDGSALIVTGTDLAMGFTPQVLMVSHPGGQVRRITNDFNQYLSPSVSAAGDAIAVVRGSHISNLWSVDPAGSGVRQITRATSRENSPWNFTTARGTILYGMLRDRSVRLFTMPASGGDARVIPTGTGHTLQVRSGGEEIAFETYNEGEQHIQRVGLDGSGLRRVTSYAGEDLLDISPDGSLITFVRSDSALGVWIAPTGGQDPYLLAARAAKGFGLFSRDGRRVLVVEYERRGELLRLAYRVFPAAGGEAVATLYPPPTAGNVQWLPDGSGIAYIDSADPARNVFRLAMSGGEPVRVTSFTELPVSNYQYSPEGARIALVRQAGSVENVWVADGGGRNVRQVTTFVGQKVFGLQWMPDSSRLVVSAGESAQDVVLIRNFR